MAISNEDLELIRQAVSEMVAQQAVGVEERRRDYFAAAALTGLITRSSDDIWMYAAKAFAIADAMLIESKKGPK